MDVQFEFKEKNGGACVTKLLAPGAVCVVPESLGGLPVTELADKVFSGSVVEKVYLLGHSPGLEDMNFIDVRNFGRFIFTGRSGKSAAVCSRAAGISGV